MRIKGKTAIVTGAANGIGAEISRTYAREGAHVVLADLAVEKAAQIAEEITGETGIRAIAVKCDVARKEEVQAVAFIALVTEWNRTSKCEENIAAVRLDRTYKFPKLPWIPIH